MKPLPPAPWVPIVNRKEAQIQIERILDSKATCDPRVSTWASKVGIKGGHQNTLFEMHCLPDIKVDITSLP